MTTTAPQLIGRRYEILCGRQPAARLDTILPSIASKWHAGDHIPILYLPERDYDSVIVAVE